MSMQESLQFNIVKTIILFAQWPGFSIAGRLEVTVVQIDTVNALQFALNEKSMQRGLYWKQGHLQPVTCIHRPSNCALNCNGPIILWNGSWWWLIHYQCHQVLHIQTCNNYCSLKIVRFGCGQLARGRCCDIEIWQLQTGQLEQNFHAT